MRASWKVYMVRCRTGELYTGCTSDLDRRLAQHNTGTASKFTRSRRPVALVYQEVCADRSAALKRENEIKRMSRTAKTSLLKPLQLPRNRPDSRS